MAYAKPYTIDSNHSGDTVKGSVIKCDDNIDDLYTNLNNYADASITFTNKTLTSPTVNSPTITGANINASTISGPTLTGAVNASGATVSFPTITGATISNGTISGATITGGSVYNATLWNSHSATVTTAVATGGANGDIWFQYTA
jgi:hypothetical protein